MADNNSGTTQNQNSNTGLSAEKKFLIVSNEVYSETTLTEMKLSTTLADNKEMMNKVMGANADLVTRDFTLGRTEVVPGTVFYIDNLIDSKHVDINIMQPLLTDSYTSELKSGSEIVSELSAGNLITRAQMKRAPNMRESINGLLTGEVVLLIEGVDNAFIISSKGYHYRQIAESEVEPVVKGPKEAFVEVLSINLGLIRRRIHSPNLVFHTLNIGEVTQTTVCMAYIKGICPSELVDEVYSRISKINIDGILGVNYIEEFINDEPYSLFPQVRDTERPDVASAALLEGRIVIISDNTPIVLIIPGEFFSLLQSAEDYYNKSFFASFIRILRYIAFFMALTLPSFYIAVSNFHQELIPTKLLSSIISARTGVPLPNFAEAFLMEFTFEILREAGLRLPKTVGQAVTIVGGLVIGQAAVQASIVSPLMVIVVSLTAISSFCIPQYNISHSIRTVRFALMLVSSILGLYGLMLGLLFLLLHLCSIRSFSVPYLTPIAPLKISDLKDTIIRLPLWAFTRRPTETSGNKTRVPSGQVPKPNKTGGDQH